MNQLTQRVAIVLLLSVAGLFGVSTKAAPPPILSGDLQTNYQVALYKSVVVHLPTPAKRVSIAYPGIADILTTHSQELYIVGKLLGSTRVTVWNDAGEAQSFNIEVTHDVDTLKAKLHELMPGEDIKVYSAQSRLILSGQVANAAHMDAALQLAAGFLPSWVPNQSDASGASSQIAGRDAKSGCDDLCKKAQVVNLMQIGGANQVMLKVTVAEMQRNLVKQLDSQLNIMNFGSYINGGAVSGGATFPNALDPAGLLTPVHGALNGQSPIGPPVTLFQPSVPTISGTGAFLSYLNSKLFIDEVLNISRTNGLAKILSEPTLTTMTGQEAQFLSGGEFPIPVPQGGASNAITIDFKKFGVNVKFLPTVLDSGRINMSVAVAVSELSSNNQVVLNAAGTTSSFVIPSITERSASSVVELGDGQTLGIAGLINDNMQGIVQKLPGLGDIPVLGQLFSSQKFQSGQTELVMFVTPHLATPSRAKQQRLPTDGFVPPGDMDFYLLGRLEAQKQSSGPPVDSYVLRNAPPTAQFGHDTSPSP